MSSSDEQDNWGPNLPDGVPPERILRRMAGKLDVFYLEEKNSYF